MADTRLKLGSFEFKDTEIPEHITVGGEQQLNVKLLVGGAKVVDVLGPKDKDIEFEGISVGKQAMTRMLYLDHLRAAGQPLELSFFELKYQVVIKNFEMHVERHYQIRYKICLETISDLTKPVTQLPRTSVDAAIKKDLLVCIPLMRLIMSNPLTKLFEAFYMAVMSIETLAAMTLSMVNMLLQPLEMCMACVDGLILTATAAYQAHTQIMASPAVMANIVALDNAIMLNNELMELALLQEALGRIKLNLQSILGTAPIVATTSGNLFQIASDVYGDAMDWTVIANANGLTDPFVTGLNKLVTPPKPTSTDGVLNG